MVEAAVVQKYAFLVRSKSFDVNCIVKQAQQLIQSILGGATPSD